MRSLSGRKNLCLIFKKPGTATYPRKVSGLENIIKIAAAGYSAYALDKDGKVYAWGKNNCGQLGIGKDTTANKTIDQCTPQAVLTQDGAEELSGIVAIAAGGNSDTSTFALALDATGQVYAWGYNDYKQVTKSSENSYALP